MEPLANFQIGVQTSFISNQFSKMTSVLMCTKKSHVCFIATTGIMKPTHTARSRWLRKCHLKKKPTKAADQIFLKLTFSKYFVAWVVVNYTCCFVTGLHLADFLRN